MGHYENLLAEIRQAHRDGDIDEDQAVRLIKSAGRKENPVRRFQVRGLVHTGLALTCLIIAVITGSLVAGGLMIVFGLLAGLNNLAGNVIDASQD